MRLRRLHRPCVRCHHFFEIHDLRIMGLDGQDVQVPCAHMDIDPRTGSITACHCPAYVAPAPLRLRLANAFLAWFRMASR